MRTVAMTPERLAELEAWARAWSRCETVGARNVLELVAEVRLLRESPPLELTVPNPLSAQEMENVRQSVMRLRCRRLVLLPIEQPAAVPPFRGILDGVTAADVHGVQV